MTVMDGEPSSDGPHTALSVTSRWVLLPSCGVSLRFQSPLSGLATMTWNVPIADVIALFVEGEAITGAEVMNTDRATGMGEVDLHGLERQEQGVQSRVVEAFPYVLAGRQQDSVFAIRERRQLCEHRFQFLPSHATLEDDEVPDHGRWRNTGAS